MFVLIATIKPILDKKKAYKLNDHVINYNYSYGEKLKVKPTRDLQSTLFQGY